MTAINVGSLAKAQMPGIRDFFGMEYNRHPDQYSRIFVTKQSNKNFEEEVNMKGFGGGGAVIPEGGDVQFETSSIGPVKRYTHIKVGKAFMITEEALDDTQYPMLIKSFSGSMGHNMKQTKETTAANILNRANNSSYASGWDSVELSSALHLLSGGGTASNELATAANLSEASLEQALIDIGGFVDDAGLKMQADGQLLIIPRQLRFEADRILKSPLKNDTAENAINAVRGYLDYTVNNFLTSSSKWFVKTDVLNGLTHYVRKPLTISDETDFSSNNMKFKFIERYCFGWSDWRGLFCNGE